VLPASVIERVRSVDRNPPPCRGKTVESVVLLGRNSVLVLLGRKFKFVLEAKDAAII
jgi:hypothetical protein